jgi:hypothetical protein
MMHCLLLFGRKKEREREKKKRKEKRNSQKAFSTKAGHTLLAVPSRIFMAVRCN